MARCLDHRGGWWCASRRRPRPDPCHRHRRLRLASHLPLSMPCDARGVRNYHCPIRTKTRPTLNSPCSKPSPTRRDRNRGPRRAWRSHGYDTGQPTPADASGTLASCRVEVWSGDQTAWLIRPPGGLIKGESSGDTLSLIPLGGDALGMFPQQNLAYPLHNETLAVGPARGISNVVTASSARVSLHDGLLLAVHTPGRA